MSSFTINTTVCGERHPVASRSGLSTLSLATPQFADPTELPMRHQRAVDVVDGTCVEVGRVGVRGGTPR